jgi:hypothetical protein
MTSTSDHDEFEFRSLIGEIERLSILLPRHLLTRVSAWVCNDRTFTVRSKKSAPDLIRRILNCENTPAQTKKLTFSVSIIPEWRQARLDYARVLLDQVSRRRLALPFDRLPTEGPLPSLPQYLVRPDVPINCISFLKIPHFIISLANALLLYC